MSKATVACLFVATVLSANLSAEDTYDGYRQAHQESIDAAQPLVVLVGADWCPHCRVMKESVIPRLRSNGSLEGVSFAVIDSDRESRLASKLMQGRGIPQMVMFTKNPNGDGWSRSYLKGSQSIKAVEAFIRKGVATSVEKTVSTTSKTH